MNEFCIEMKVTNTLKKKMAEQLKYSIDKNCFEWVNKTQIYNELPINLKY